MAKVSHGGHQALMDSCCKYIDAVVRKMADEALADYKQWNGSRDALVDYIHEALKLRYGEEDRYAAEFIAKNIPVTKQKGGV